MSFTRNVAVFSSISTCGRERPDAISRPVDAFVSSFRASEAVSTMIPLAHSRGACFAATKCNSVGVFDSALFVVLFSPRIDFARQSLVTAYRFLHGHKPAHSSLPPSYPAAGPSCDRLARR